MDNPHRNPLLLQIQTQQLPHHIQCALTRMMAIIAPSLALMPQRDTPALAAHENDLAPLGQQPSFDQIVHDKNRADRADGVHLHLVVPGRLVEGFGAEVTGGDDDSVEALHGWFDGFG